MSWGVEDETAPLRDVLLGPPDHFRWLPTSAISKAALASGRTLTPADSAAAHREMAAAYEDAGVAVHRLEPDPALAYQVFARDSSIWTSAGPVVTQMNQWWRRGEYAPVIGFYQGAGIAIDHMVTAAAFEGGDLVLPAPRCALIGHCEERTQEPAARQVAAWLEALGWEVRVQPFDPHFVHIDVIVCMAAPGLAVICEEAAPPGLVEWLKSKGLELLPVGYARCHAAGRKRDGARRRSGDLHRRGRLAQRPLARAGPAGLRPGPVAVHDGRRRAALPRAAPAPRPCGLRVDADRVIADLRELDRRTGGPGGARRVCWTPSGPPRGTTSASCWSRCRRRSRSTPPATSGPL